jgi:membrane associated rhomboid family serine protease
LTVADPTLLVTIFIVWAVTCAAVGVASLRHAPAVSLAMFGSVLGAIGGFLVGNADGPAEVPAYKRASRAGEQAGLAQARAASGSAVTRTPR